MNCSHKTRNVYFEGEHDQFHVKVPLIWIFENDTAVHKAAMCSQTTALNAIDQSDQSTQISITQRRSLEK